MSAGLGFTGLGAAGSHGVGPAVAPVPSARRRRVQTRRFCAASKREAKMTRNPNDRNQQIPEERMIDQALAEVENMGAHPLLTDVVCMLGAARRTLGEWHDAGRPGGYWPGGEKNASLERTAAELEAYKAGGAKGCE